MERASTPTNPFRHGGLFDVIPSLESWNGVAAAGIFHVIHPWIVPECTAASISPLRTQSGESPTIVGPIPDDDVQALLSLAGLHLGDQVLDFPRLTTHPPTLKDVWPSFPMSSLLQTFNPDLWTRARGER